MPVINVYSTSFRKAFIQLKRYNPNQMELAVVTYVIADYAAASCGKNRYELQVEIKKWIAKTLKPSMDFDEFTDFFNRRNSFYASVIRGKPLHGLTCPTMDLTPSDEINALFRCAVAFMDCTLFPPFAEDYDGAPYPLGLELEAMEAFERGTMPLYKLFVSLFKNVYDY